MVSKNEKAKSKNSGIKNECGKELEKIRENDGMMRENKKLLKVSWGCSRIYRHPRIRPCPSIGDCGFNEVKVCCMRQMTARNMTLLPNSEAITCSFLRSNYTLACVHHVSENHFPHLFYKL